MIPHGRRLILIIFVEFELAMPFSQIWERYVGCYHSWWFISEEILNTRTDCIFHEKMKVHRKTGKMSPRYTFFPSWPTLSLDSLEKSKVNVARENNVMAINRFLFGRTEGDFQRGRT